MNNSNIWKIIDSYFSNNPQCLVQHHIESYDDFFKKLILQLKYAIKTYKIKKRNETHKKWIYNAHQKKG